MKPKPLQISDFRKSTSHRLAFLIGTGMGVGLSPVGPGTLGSLLGVGLAIQTQTLPPVFQFLFWVLFSGIGIWASAFIVQESQSADHPSIVVDEISGMWAVAAFCDPSQPVTYLLAFLLFRLFDIAKPPPIRALDSWSKRQFVPHSSFPWKIGFGVILDDWLAAVFALIAHALITYWVPFEQILESL